MTWTGYWRGIVRVARTGIDIYLASVVMAVVAGFVKIEGWYIGPLAAIIAGAAKTLRVKHPDSIVWKYLPL